MADPPHHPSHFPREGGGGVKHETITRSHVDRVHVPSLARSGPKVSLMGGVSMGVAGRDGRRGGEALIGG